MCIEWKNWCRLCGCKNNSVIDVFIKDENFFSLSEAIQRYLSITIFDVDEAPKKICIKCQTLISEFVTFCMKATKIQEMYSELQFNDKFEMLTNVEQLREKYGLSVDEEVNLKNRISERYSFDEEEDQEQPLKRKRRNRTSKTVIKSEEKDPTDDEIDKIIDENEKTRLEKSINGVLDKKKKDVKANVEIEVHKNRKIFRKKPEIKAKTHPKKYEIFCEVCDRGFSNQGGYTAHLKLTHKIIKQPETYTCKTCGKVYQRADQFKTHESTHLPPDQRKLYPCPLCDKKFTAETSIAGHIQAVHIKEKCFVCEECGKAFVTSSRLAGHKLVHSDETPFKCSKCTKSFKCSESLKRHMDSHDDKKYICPICGAQLNTKRILREHMIIHSDAKKFKCNICDKDFKRTKEFKNHLILHTGIKPYQCPFCDQTFANGSNCRKHQKTTHPRELAEAEEAGTIQITRNIPSMQLLKAVNEEAILNNINSR